MPPKSDSPLDSPPPYDDSDAGGVNNDHSDGENSSHPSMPSLVSISDDDSNHGIDDITARLQTMSTTPRAPRAMLNSTNGAPRRARDFLADSASELNGPHRASARLARRALNAALVDRLNNPPPLHIRRANNRYARRTRHSHRHPRTFNGLILYTLMQRLRRLQRDNRRLRRRAERRPRRR
ncbi:hypothetical protein R3P38DRAFT_3228511 [Favolaschia claudopus]|uniref:Uncharacterized protein n=1 Tax=Favolaschia claudopus TaxID=2862362 RepID=A0AAV9ZQH0_9AGAR